MEARNALQLSSHSDPAVIGDHLVYQVDAGISHSRTFSSRVISADI